MVEAPDPDTLRLKWNLVELCVSTRRKRPQTRLETAGAFNLRERPTMPPYTTPFQHSLFSSQDSPSSPPSPPFSVWVLDDAANDEPSSTRVAHDEADTDAVVFLYPTRPSQRILSSSPPPKSNSSSEESWGCGQGSVLTTPDSAFWNWWYDAYSEYFFTLSGHDSTMSYLMDNQKSLDLLL
jgi:hypothetical protein